MFTSSCSLFQIVADWAAQLIEANILAYPLNWQQNMRYTLQTVYQTQRLWIYSIMKLHYILEICEQICLCIIWRPCVSLFTCNGRPKPCRISFFGNENTPVYPDKAKASWETVHTTLCSECNKCNRQFSIHYLLPTVAIEIDHRWKGH